MTPSKERVSRYSNNDLSSQLTASRAGAGIAGLERLLVSALTKIVGTSVDDDGTLECVSNNEDREFHPRIRTPITLSGPISLTNLSLTVPLALPWASVLMLPRSPTWRTSSSGAP